MGNSLSHNDPFRREECAANITAGLQKHTIPWDPSIFISIADVLNPILTLDGCKELCGSGTGWYTDIGPRLVTWFLPIFLLVSNMQFPLIGMERFLLILHLIGDPIDSIWSLLKKVKSWSRCYARARKRLTDKSDIKSLAVINAFREEVQDTPDHEPEPTDLHDMTLIRTTAVTLIRHRSNEILRTSFAVLMYIFQVVCAFVPAVGASSKSSGGMIGPAMLLSWLVCIVLLSNAVGDLGSPGSNEKTIAEFMECNRQPIAHQRPDKDSKLTIRCLGVDWTSKTSHEASGIWSGSMYCYQPDKRLGNSGWNLAVISVLPVAIAFGAAFGVLETGPTYFSCRHLLVIFAFIFWLFSAALSYILPRANLATGKYLWYIILIKDFLISTPILGLIVASGCGYWNTCACWGGAFVHGAETRIQLSPLSVFNHNDDVEYPAMVATCLALQLCMLFVMLGIEWDGFRALRWSEEEKQNAAGSNRSLPVPEVESQAGLRDLSGRDTIKDQIGTEITYMQSAHEDS